MKKLNIQRLFCFISILFIGGCCLYYGGKFAKLYLENKKTEIAEENSLAKVIKDNHSDNLKEINGETYFTGNEDNNYLEYANILWRIIKVNNNNSLTLISNNSLTPLAYDEKKDFKSSPIFKWLNNTNEELSGILENSITNKNEYLTRTTSCTDIIDELSNNPCNDVNNENYFTLLSVVDYLNIGSKDSYLNNGEYFYLSNTNKDNKIWYVNDDGLIKLSTGNDIYGIRPVTTIKANIDYISGDGTLNNPYKIEKENILFGSYVKLGNDIWRIYKIEDNLVKLSLNDYLKVNNSELSYNYSKNTSFHNDLASGSIAYYLNNNFLNTLSYKDKIKEIKWSNGYYNKQVEFDYTYSLKPVIDTKVAMLNIGDIILNPKTTNYFTMTGTNDKGSAVYVIMNDMNIYTKSVTSKANIIPTISLDKDLLTKGNGTIDSPYEME